jgi:hypothetical protein
MPPRDRRSITKGMFMTMDAGVPAHCAGLDPPAVRVLGVPYKDLKRRPDPDVSLAEVERRLAAAKKTLDDIAATVRARRK